MPLTHKPVTYQKTTIAEEKRYQEEWDKFKKQQAAKNREDARWKWYEELLDRVTSKEKELDRVTSKEKESEKSIFDGGSSFFSSKSEARVPLLKPSTEVVQHNAWYPEKIR